jgi:hypothetical protein
VSAVAITSRNAGSVRTRTVGSALYNMCVQASNIISSNVRPSILPFLSLSLHLSTLFTPFCFPQPLTQRDTHISPFQIYNAPDAPLYRTGNKVLLGLVAWNVVLIISIRYYYKWRNSRRDKVWNSLTQEERDNYLATTKDQGSKRLDFRFAY